jgi:hypothetical protein
MNEELGYIFGIPPSIDAKESPNRKYLGQTERIGKKRKTDMYIKVKKEKRVYSDGSDECNDQDIMYSTG